MLNSTGAGGDLGKFLGDFGAALRAKYKPKGIVVFSAHWNTTGVRHGEHCNRTLWTSQLTDEAVTDYGDMHARPSCKVPKTNTPIIPS
jgi:aromatic ring-opening dioxygenase catalytic subunit (LigB family)